jgi:hypothetical protein
VGWGDEVEMLDPPAVVNSVHLVFALDRFNLGLIKRKENGSYSRIISEFIHGVKAD